MGTDSNVMMGTDSTVMNLDAGDFDAWMPDPDPGDAGMPCSTPVPWPTARR